MTFIDRVYPTHSFEELAQDVRQEAVRAGQLGFVRMHERFRGVFDSVIVDDAAKAWTSAMDKVDRAYGTCRCGDTDFIQECPSFDEHVLVAEFIVRMEEAGFAAADHGFKLTPDTVAMYTQSVVTELSK